MIRLGPGEPPLSAKQLHYFYANAVNKKTLRSALKFYERYGVMHFVYSPPGLASWNTGTCNHMLSSWSGARRSCSYFRTTTPEEGDSSGPVSCRSDKFKCGIDATVTCDCPTCQWSTRWSTCRWSTGTEPYTYWQSRGPVYLECTPEEVMSNGCFEGYAGTYFLSRTETTEEWVRCTTATPKSLRKLDTNGLSCAAVLGDKQKQLEKTKSGKKSTLPEGSIDEDDDGLFFVVGADAFRRSPSEIAAETKYGMPGVPHSECHDELIEHQNGRHTVNGRTPEEGGFKYPCESWGWEMEVGVDRGGDNSTSSSSASFRRFVTPNWENGQDWMLFTLNRRTLRSSFSPTEATSLWSLDESSAYPDVLFAGGLTLPPYIHHRFGGVTDFMNIGPSPKYFYRPSWKDGEYHMVMFNHSWVNLAESGSAPEPPAMPGISIKSIAGRWREPQLLWSSPRSFMPVNLVKKFDLYDWNPPIAFTADVVPGPSD